MSKKAVENKIMVFGTFDGLHKGHLNFFKQARTLAANPYLIVSIARDKNVFKIKGEYPAKNEKARLALVKKSRLANRVILSGLARHVPHIAREKPDLIALGYDQRAYVKNLKEDLKKAGITAKIVRLKPYKEKIYKNHLLKAKREI
jgi:FAD synthetase